MKKIMIYTLFMTFVCSFAKAELPIYPKLSDEFYNHLENCLPYKENNKKNMMFFEVNTTSEIVGKNGDKCDFQFVLDMQGNVVKNVCSFDKYIIDEVLLKLHKDPNAFEGSLTSDQAFRKYFNNPSICKVIKTKNEFSKEFMQKIASCSPVEEKQRIKMMGTEIDIIIKIDGLENGMCKYRQVVENFGMQKVVECLQPLDKLAILKQTEGNNSVQHYFGDKSACVEKNINLLALNLAECKDYNGLMDIDVFGIKSKISIEIKKQNEQECKMTSIVDDKGAIKKSICIFNPAQRAEVAKTIYKKNEFEKLLKQYENSCVEEE